MNHASRTLTDALLDPILKNDPAGPRVTFYDDATGERVELSALTLANWAAKTANLLRDEFAVEPGARVAVLLPAHWQTAAVLLGVWWAGAEVVLEPDADAEIALVSAAHLSDVEDVPEVAALSLDAFGRPVPDLPVGITDYATSVRVHGDQFRPTVAGPALAGKSVDDVLAAALASAETHGITGSDRVLSVEAWDSPDALIDGLVAVFAAGASLVQVTNPDTAAQARRMDTEKITRQLSR
ncbi:TIGR03089 family protein [Rhodococcus pseudokoreensis]|uniref:TIGR03089 family protein n=1 Tax=Rhodococcus pseudokoreensis TaxID=2811421 RepID=A0A974W060_9NOCA|nr:TIGR03089 family protein [Rhodococcus pseudokoreensis]QSE88845.1 TIGR03089 family protein [Rhodococcus pseudokoreensis]